MSLVERVLEPEHREVREAADGFVCEVVKPVLRMSDPGRTQNQMLRSPKLWERGGTRGRALAATGGKTQRR